jgi:hypothetical protein
MDQRWIVVRTGRVPGVQSQVSRVVGCVLARDEATASLRAAQLPKHPTQQVYCVAYDRALPVLRLRADAIVV